MNTTNACMLKKNFYGVRNHRLASQWQVLLGQGILHTTAAARCGDNDMKKRHAKILTWRLAWCLFVGLIFSHQLLR